MDLANPIHPIFARSQFEGGLTVREYKFIRPALRLASRFITEDNYLSWWVHLRFGEVQTRYVVVEDEDELRDISDEDTDEDDDEAEEDEGNKEADEDDKEVDGDDQEADDRYDDDDVTEYEEEVFVAPDQHYNHLIPAEKRAIVAEDLLNLANNVTFFFKDPAWSIADDASGGGGETFFDRQDRVCKRIKALNSTENCENCKHCIGIRHQVCPICGLRYYPGRPIEHLLEICGSIGLTDYKGDSREQLVDRLEIANDAAGLPFADEFDPADLLDDIHIGLHYNVIKQIRERTRDCWLESEELRFQFQVAATLVHELAHAYGFSNLDRCHACSAGREPYWDGSERIKTRNVGGVFSRARKLVGDMSIW